MSKNRKKKDRQRQRFRQRQQQGGNGGAPRKSKATAKKGNQGMATAAAPPAPVLEHRYNDDLLAQAADREYISRVYPDLLHVLDHPELRAEFGRYNALANGAKKGVH